MKRIISRISCSQQQKASSHCRTIAVPRKIGPFSTDKNEYRMSRAGLRTVHHQRQHHHLPSTHRISLLLQNQHVLFTTTARSYRTCTPVGCSFRTSFLSRPHEQQQVVVNSKHQQPARQVEESISDNNNSNKSEQNPRRPIVGSFLVHRAHELLDSISNDNGSIKLRNGDQEAWSDSLECLYQLTNERTVESVDLSLLLLDQLVKHHKAQFLENIKNNDSSTPKNFSLLDRDLWHSAFLNWQQVSRELLTPEDNNNNIDDVDDTYIHKPTFVRRNRIVKANLAMEEDKQLTSPEKLLALLDGWSESVVDKYGRPYDFTTNKAMSLMLDVLGRRGKCMAMTAPSRQISTTQHQQNQQQPLIRSALFAETLLRRMLQKHKSSNNTDPDDDASPASSPSSHNKAHFAPSVDNLNMVLLLLGRTGQADRAWKLLRDCCDAIPPNIFSYNALLQAYAVTGNGKAAEQVLQELLQTSGSTSGKAVVEPNVECWNLVFLAWARADDPQYAAEQVEQLLITMMKQPSTGTQPDLSTFNTALSAYARAGEADTCARLLSEMQDLYESGRLRQPPDAISYGTVMNSLAKRGRAETAERFLEDMYTAYLQYKMTEMRPTLPLVTSVLEAHSNSLVEAVANQEDWRTVLEQLDRARHMYQRMHEWYQSGVLLDRPDSTANNVLLGCYLRASYVPIVDKDNQNKNPAAMHADALLRQWKQQAANTDSKVLQRQYGPDFNSHSIVIQALLQRPDGLSKAMGWWKEFWDLHQQPDSNTFCDAKSLHSILVLLSRKHGRPDIAQEWLFNVCEQRRRNRDPLSSTFSSRTEAPRLATVGTIVAAWSKKAKLANDSTAEDAAMEAQTLVDRWEDYHRLGVVQHGPDMLVYSTLVTCWTNCQHPDAGDRSYSILHKMRDLAAAREMSYPDMFTYGNVIHNFSRGNVDAVRAERVLRELYHDYQKGCLVSTNTDGSRTSPLLDLKCFNTTLSAWSRVKNVARVEALFHEMQRLYERGELSQPCDIVTYNILLHTWARTRNPLYAERAERLVQQMILMTEQQQSTKRPSLPPPNLITFGSLLKAWVEVGDFERALRVLQVMCHEFEQKGRQDMKPQRRHFDQLERLVRTSRQPQEEQQMHQRLRYLKELEQRLSYSGLSLSSSES